MVRYARRTKSQIEKQALALCETILADLERAKRPKMQATKCALDNTKYNASKGFLVPAGKKVTTELNVSSVKKMSRAIFMLEMLLDNVKSGGVNQKRELYYMCKGLFKQNSRFRPLDFDDQSESDATIDFICDYLECYREELNCFANDRGGQTYCRDLIVKETLPDGAIAKDFEEFQDTFKINYMTLYGDSSDKLKAAIAPFQIKTSYVPLIAGYSR